MQAMASLLLRNVVLNSARLLNCGVASRSFYSWLPGRSQTVSPLRAFAVPNLCAVDPLPFLTRCPLPTVQPVAGMKTKGVLKRRCKDCFFVRRRGRMFVYCKTHPRHKQRKL